MTNTTETNQYNGEDIFCKDENNMVTTTPAMWGKIFITAYKKDISNDVWVMEWVIKKEI